jgi:hypothetical protein
MTSTGPALARGRAQLAGAIAPQWRDVAVPRTARIPHTCIGAAEIRGYVITAAYAEPLPGNITSSSAHADSPGEADRKAAGFRTSHPGADVTVEPRPNPDYRPDCLGVIAPGDPYVDYIGEAALAGSGRPYCVRCATAAWGRGIR